MSKLILVVEDDEDNKRVIGQIVRYVLGHQVIIADDGREALRLARENRPDLILMDLSLPEIDGWSATALLKKMDGLSKVPIIAVTAHAMVGDRNKAIEAGCDDYISKPINIDDFVEMVGKYLANEKE